MTTFNLEHVSLLDDNFYKYLVEADTLIKTHDSLLDGLKDLNSEKSKSKIVFINSKCANKGYLCINCKKNEYNNLKKTIHDIILLHSRRKDNINKIFTSFK